MSDLQLNPHSPIETGIEHFVAGSGAGTVGRGRSPRTQQAYGVDLDQFARFLHTCIAGPTVTNITPTAVADFASHLADLGRQPRTVARKLAAVRALFHHLCATGVCSANPARGVRAPAASPAPAPPTAAQVEALLALPEADAFAGARDRAILELLYGAGLRLSELVQLNLSHLALDDEQVQLRGLDDRSLRLGPTATAAVRAYLLRRAEALVSREIGAVDAGALFVSARGRRLHPRTIQRLVAGYQRGLEGTAPLTRPAPRRRLGPGALRAACERHLIDAGADPGLVASLLGRRAASRSARPRPTAGAADLEVLAARYRQAHPRA